MSEVVVTGIGLITALGEGREPTWQALIDGRTGIAPLTAYDASSLATRQGARPVGFDARRYVERKARRFMTPVDEYATAAAVLALRDAGLDRAGLDADRTALFAGGNKELCRPEGVVEGALAVRAADGSADFARLGRIASSVFPPLFYVEGLQPAALFFISQMFGLRGPNSYFHGTAEAGANAIARAARAIRRGEADLALAGGFDDPTAWWPMSHMDTLGVLTDRNELGPSAFRPFDQDRSGSLLGDGAVFLVLERRDAAMARGARCYAEIAGSGAANDRKVLTPESSGHALSAAITRALDDAALQADRVDYIAAHGCATRLGDIAEARAIRRSLGSAADSVAASSVKPQTGHLVGAAGALNIAVAALALHHGVLPPTLHLENPDPECDLDWVPKSARDTRIGAALAVARGLAGQQVAVALRRTA
ncbi:3-oxoacyl-[acyl-carrier-protein] synthase II [Nocardia tenerifensis]|uniref:3-oxoacyl-[acyl-carrier-protein] synthase II n=2 Tax=Nocardia tenerifensis TaxID=228006 RepID=A0A318JQ76_9NOCA|nr:beta-ketoacyl-[acyl-carrier-protein] synthase family protein [Nocardia tenerifensis]PXX55547.1 3-oxoacyl-[acyl-carrier-protein] synthase II [Nocardia tenerifensis]